MNRLAALEVLPSSFRGSTQVTVLRLVNEMQKQGKRHREAVWTDGRVALAL